MGIYGTDALEPEDVAGNHEQTLGVPPPLHPWMDASILIRDSSANTGDPVQETKTAPGSQVPRSQVPVVASAEIGSKRADSPARGATAVGLR